MVRITSTLLKHRRMEKFLVVAIVFFLMSLSALKVFAETTSNTSQNGYASLYRAPGIQLCRLLYLESVRKKVGLKDGDFAMLRQKIEVLSNALPPVEEFASGSPQDQANLLEKIAIEAEQIEPEVWSMASKMIGREGIDKIMVTYLSYHGLEAVLNERIAERMRLSSEQQTKIKAAIENLRAERGVIWAQISSGEGIQKAKADELLILRGSAYDYVIRPILTKEQIVFLEPMNKFEIRNASGQVFTRFTFGW